MKYMDDNHYFAIRNNVEFYFWGTGCIADYLSVSIAYLDEIDINILKISVEKSTVIDVVCNASQKLGLCEDECIERMQRLVKKGVLVFRDYPMESPLIFFGERGLYYPKKLTIELTSKCNYMCPFCFMNATSQGNFISDENINNIYNLTRGKINNILLTGGEPTLHPHFFNYVDLFSQTASEISIITNGSMLYKYENQIQTLNKLKVIQFSLYGRSNNEYKLLTGAPNGFTNLQKSIELARKTNAHVRCTLTLSDQTINNIESFVETAIQLGPDSFGIGIADEYGRAVKMYQQNDFASKIEKAVDKIIELQRKYRKEIKIDNMAKTFEHGYISQSDDLKYNVYSGMLDCGAGTEVLTISSEGKIRACQYCSAELFSISDENALYEHIHGNFHEMQLIEGIKRHISIRKQENYHELCCPTMEEYIKARKELDNI